VRVLPVTSSWLILLEESRVEVGLHALESTSICKLSVTDSMDFAGCVPRAGSCIPADAKQKCSLEILEVSQEGGLTWHHLAHVHRHTAHSSGHSTHWQPSHRHPAHHIIHASSAPHARAASHPTHHATAIVESSKVSAHWITREATHWSIEAAAHVTHTGTERIVSVEVVHAVVHIGVHIATTVASSTEIATEVSS
jgi:hypothetical protein